MDEPIKDLWLGLKENVSGFSVDFNTFKSDMADEAKRSRLHNSLVQKGLYTKTLEDFNSQFMGSVPVKKKETTSQPSSPVAKQPIAPSSTIQNSFGIETVNPTQETQNSIGGQPLPNNSRISPLSPETIARQNAANGAMIPDAYFQQETAPINVGGQTIQMAKYDYANKPEQAFKQESKNSAAQQQKDLAAQSTSKEFSNTMLNSNSPLIKEKSLFAQSLTRDVKPEEQALIQQNFSNLSPDYQQDVANYLAKVQVENPSKHAELVSRVGENGLDQKTKAQILGQATNDRLQTAARDFAILEARNKSGKEINPNDAEETVTRYNKSISDMSNVLQQFPEELDRVRKIKAQNDEMTIKDSDSFLTQIAKQTGAALGGVQNALLDGAKSTLEWARDVSDQLSGEQDTRGLTDKFVEGMGNFLDSWHAATPTKYKDEKDLTGEATGGAQGFISQLGSQFGTMALLYKMGAGSSPRLVTAGAATTYSQYYDEADKTGSLSKDGVQKYALFQSTIQGLLELVSPNFGAAEFEKVGLKNGINFLKNNPNASIGDFAKNYLKHNTAEVSQESTQNIGDIVGKLAANEIVGKNTFDPSTTMEEQMQTVTMTTATTLLVSFFTKGHFKAYHKQSLDFLRNVPEAKLVEELNQQVKDGQLTYSQGEKIRQLVKDKTVTPTVEGEKPTMDTPSVEAPKILEQVDEKGNLIPIDKIKETPTPSVKPTEKVQEVNEEDLTKETLLNESKTSPTPSEPTKTEVKPTTETNTAVEPTPTEAVTAPKEEPKVESIPNEPRTNDRGIEQVESVSQPTVDTPSVKESVEAKIVENKEETPEQRTERVNKTVKESGLTAKEQRAVLGIINETPDGKLTALLSPTERAKVDKVVSEIYKQDKLNAPEKTAEQKAQDAAEAPVKKNKVYDEFEPTNLKEELEQYLAKGGQINEADFNAYFGDGKGGIQEEAKKWKDSVSPDAPSLDQATEGMKFKGHGTDTKNAFQEILQENEGSKTVGDKIKAKHAERKAVLEGKNNPFESEDYEKAMEALEEQKAATSSTKELSEQDAKDYHEHSTKVDALEEQAKSDPSVKAKHDEAYNRIINDPQYQKEDGTFDYEKLEDNIKNGFEPDILEIYNSNNTEDENTKTITETVKSVRDSKASESGGNTEKGERGNTEGGTDGKQAAQEALKDNTPTEIDENNVMDALNDKQAFIDQKTSELDAAIEQAEKDLKKSMKGIVASSGLPFNKGGVFESAVKLGYLKFKRFFYSNGRMMSMSEMATALGTKVSDGFKNVYNSVVNIWNKENSSSFHEELSNADQAARLIQDKNVAIKNLYNDLKNAGVEITDEVNFAEMQELSTSKIADAQRRTAEWFRGMEGDAQITGIAKSQKESWVGRVKEQIGSYKEQLDYMFAKHALDYNARAREIVAKRNEAEIKDKQTKVDTLTEEYLAETDPSVQKKLQDKITKLNNEITAIQNEPMPDMPSGMTDADAQAILDEAVKDPDKMAKMDAFAKEFRDEVVLKRLDLLEQSGIISAETAQQMRDGKREGFVSEMPNYLPLKVKSENFTEIAKPTTLRALGSKIFGIKVSNEFEREKRYDPLQMAVTELQAAQSAAVQNEGLNALYEAVKQSPFGKQIKIINTRGTSAANEDGQLTDTKTEPKVEVAALLQDHAIPFKVGGKIKYLFFTPIKTAEGKLKPHPVIQALKTQPKDTPNIIKSLMNGMRVMTNYLRLIRTTYNIGFAADNPFRDLGEALTNISDVADSKTAEKIRLQIIKNTPTSFAYFFNPSKKRIGLDGQTRTKEFDQYFDEMRREGVTMSWGNYEGIDEKIDNFQGDIDRIEQGKYGKTGTQIAMTSFKVLGALSEATENTTRLSVYAAMRQNGFSPQKAAYVAKNITLNFEKGGTATPVVNMLWMFSNAGIQGTARVMKAAKTANFWRFGAAMTLYAALNHAALLLNMDDDDEDKWIYNNIEAKGRTLIYNPLDPKNPIRLPKPYSAMRIFLNMGEGITDVYFGKKTISDVAVNNVGDALMSAIDPLGGSGNSKTNYIPTEPLKNYYQVQFNENWAGQPIYRGEEKANKKDLPDYLRTNPNTPSKYDRMALGLHDNIGLDMQPTTLEFIYDNYAKNAVNSVTDYGKLATSAYDWATGKEVKAEDVPALKRFYSNIEDKAKGKAVLYNVLDLLDKPDNITKEQIRFAESQLSRFRTDGTPSFFINKIQTGINEAKNPSIRKAKDDAELNKFKEGIDKKAAAGK